MQEEIKMDDRNLILEHRLDSVILGCERNILEQSLGSVGEEHRVRKRELKGWKHSPEAIAKMSASNKGHPVSQETRKKLSVAHSGKTLSLEHRKKIGLSNKGKIVSADTRKKKSQNAKKQWNNPISRNKILAGVIKASKSPERCLKISRAMKGRVPSKSTLDACKIANRARKGEKRSKYVIKDRALYRQKRLEMWSLDSYVANQMRARQVRPNKVELYLQAFLNKHFSDTWKYVGDGQLIIGGKCPDFTNINGRKQLIELFGNYWHKDDNPEDKIGHYRKFGFDCLVIWENELNKEDELMQKVKEFVSE